MIFNKKSSESCADKKMISKINLFIAKSDEGKKFIVAKDLSDAIDSCNLSGTYQIKLASSNVVISEAVRRIL